MTDAQLLREYAGSGSEAAFAELVSRYAGLVHAAALRQTGNPDWAEDVTQAVFVLLARKAGALSPDIVLAGWLI
ncbi:MAG: sigma-70 family RNA polymerase sigma factor, partial [Verrucomicrobiae bacterium]|nr:sigma-70 family RNA polymerase sigma factor [Verrucomicrobiae bacterium]